MGEIWRGRDPKQLWLILFLSFTELHMLGPTFLLTGPQNEGFIFSTSVASSALRCQQAGLLIT